MSEFKEMSSNLTDDNSRLLHTLDLAITQNKRVSEYLAKVSKRQKISIQSVLGSQFFIRLAEKSRSVFWIRSADYKIQLYVSPAYEEIWGRPCSYAIDSPEKWADDLHPDDRKTIKDQLELRNSSASLETRYDEQYRIIRPDGTIRWIKDSSFPVYDDDGNCIGFAGIAEDITKEKEYQESLIEAKKRAEAASETKSEFLAAVNHELRTPLTGMLGMARLLASEPLAPEYGKQVNDIVDAGEHLLLLVNDLLDIAKLESGKFDFNPAPLDLRKLIEETAIMLSAQVNSKKLELRVNYPVDLPHLVMADSKAIRQILLNLVGNALKFTHEGHIEIQVECLEQNTKKAKLKISVKDTGIGIPKDKLDSVFERFNQVDNSRTRKYGGTGLGLTISKLYIELMGGNIKVKSDLNQGSTFYFILNFPLQTESKMASIWEPYKANVRILIIDDSLNGVVLMKHIGSCLCELINSNEALNHLLAADQRKQPFDVVLIDENLKEANAKELGTKINQQHNLHKVMLVLLTKSPSLPERETAKEAGFFECIVKPTHPTQLLSSLAAAWQKWEERLRPQLAIKSLEGMGQLNVLLVEDDPIIQKVHSMMLTKIGCKVEIASDGKQALTMYPKGYDVIFMDVGLGEISGLEVAQTIRQQENGETQVPIIAMTGYGDNDSKESCIAAGMNDIAIKPTTPEILKQLLEQWAVKVPVF